VLFSHYNKWYNTADFFLYFAIRCITAPVSVTLFPCVVPQKLKCHCLDTLIILVNYLPTNLSQADTVLVKYDTTSTFHKQRISVQPEFNVPLDAQWLASEMTIN